MSKVKYKTGDTVWVKYRFKGNPEAEVIYIGPARILDIFSIGEGRADVELPFSPYPPTSNMRNLRAFSVYLKDIEHEIQEG